MVQKYRTTVTRYIFGFINGNVDTFWKCTVFGTVVTFLTVLLDISLPFFGMDFERKNWNFFKSEHNFHSKDDH